MVFHKALLLDPNCFFCILIFAMYRICLISFYMLMIEMFFYKHENIDMCKIVSIKKLCTWLAIGKLALNISKQTLGFF